MTPRDDTQLTLNFEPSLAERYGCLRDYIGHRIHVQPRPLKAIAADMDMSPSLLSRKLAPTEGDSHRFNVDDLERYIVATGDTTAIDYLAAKYLIGDEQRRVRAIGRLEILTTELERTLRVVQGGIQPPRKARR